MDDRLKYCVKDKTGVRDGTRLLGYEKLFTESMLFE